MCFHEPMHTQNEKQYNCLYTSILVRICGPRFTPWKTHDDVIQWKHFPRYWPFVRGIHWSPVNSQHKGQWRGALMFSSICAWIHRRVNNGEAADLRRYRTHYDVMVMCIVYAPHTPKQFSYFFKTSFLLYYLNLTKVYGFLLVHRHMLCDFFNVSCMVLFTTSVVFSPE